MILSHSPHQADIPMTWAKIETQPYQIETQPHLLVTLKILRMRYLTLMVLAMRACL